MVDPTPDTLLYGAVGTRSTIVPVISESGANISRIAMTWKTTDDTDTPTVGCPVGVTNVFSPADVWTCGYGVVRVDLLPTNGTFDYAGLQSRTMTTFLVPLSTGGNTSQGYAAGGGNNVLGVDCSDDECIFSFSGLSVNQYYMRISSAYKPVSIRVNGYDASNNLLALKDAQAVIDATGRAQDVLRRVQVHVPLTASSQNQLSDYGLQSTDSICKRFEVMNNYFKSKVSGITSTNPLCQLTP